MSLLELMEKNGIDKQWLFVLARVHNKEGLFFFEPIAEENEETGEVSQSLETKCFLIDGEKFNYSDDMEKDVEIHAVDSKVRFTRLDGAEIDIDMKEFNNFPFKLIEFESTIKHEVPQGFTKIEN